MAQELSPLDALDRFLGVVRDAAREDPAFARKLVGALGLTVRFDTEDYLYLEDPVHLAATVDEDRFRAIYGEPAVKPGMADLKRLLAEANLALPDELTGLKSDELIDLLWSRASRKAAERRA